MAQTLTQAAVLEETGCPLCPPGTAARAPDRVVHRRGSWLLRRCDGCRLVYLGPRPSFRAMHESFEWFHHGHAQTRARRRRQGWARRLFRRTRGTFRRRREDVVLERVRRLVPSGRFLDIGCGDAAMVEWMARHGYDAHGLDASPAAVELARESGIANVTLGTIHDAPLENESFDAVLLMSVLEHEHRPVAALREIARVLRPGGHLFIKVPNYACWNRVLLGDGWSGYFFPQHLYYFTPATLERAASLAGLATARSRFLDHVPLSDVMWFTARRPSA